MFGIGFFELVIIIILAFILLDIKDLPRIIKTFGKFYKKFLIFKQETKDIVSKLNEDIITKEFILDSNNNKTIKNHQQKYIIDENNQLQPIFDLAELVNNQKPSSNISKALNKQK